MRRELPAAGVVLLAALTLYWSTLAPGLLGLIDTPKFQFIGAVLGVPHPPGYPIYVIVSSVFAHLPFGSLAYRINLMSAVFGALTVALVYLCGRRAGAGRLVSGVGAFGLGCGPLFWSAAVVAEVYTLHTALLAAILLALLTWRETRSPAAYVTAVVCFAVSLGHHTTMLLMAPAFAAYVLSVDARFVLTPRRLVLTVGIMALGLAPYGFIALRTLQGAPYVETPITSVADFVAAFSSRRWQSALFAFDVRTLLLERVPFVARTLGHEFSWAGAFAVVGGVLFVLVRRRPLGLLLVGAGAINALFVLVYDIVEIAVFLLPTVLVGWLCAIVVVGELGPVVRRRGRARAAMLAGVLIGWAAWHAERGYAESDRSNEVQEMRRFDALFEMLPDRSVVVADDYLVNSMIQYKLLGERAGGARNIRGPLPPNPDRMRQLHEDGFQIFAFAREALALRLNGFRFGEASLFESVERSRVYASDEDMDQDETRIADAKRGVELDQGVKGFGVAHIESMQLYRLLATGSCQELRAGERVDVSQLAAAGKLVARLSDGASLAMQVGRETPLAPRLTYLTDGSLITLDTHRLTEAEGAASTGTEPAYLFGLTLDSSGSTTTEAATLVFGGIPELAVARHVGRREGTVRICSATLGYDGLFGDPDRRVERIDWRRNGHDELLGYGWSGRFPNRLRRIVDTTAELLLPIWRPGNVRVSVTAARPEWVPNDRLGDMQLSVDGRPLETLEIARGWATYEWTIPARLVSALVSRVVLHVSPVEVEPEEGSRPLGMRIQDVTLALDDS